VREFLETLPSFRPDVFLLDVNLPDGNGINLCREIKKSQDFRESFFIILTSMTDNKTLEAAYNAGADDYFRKPFVQYELLSKLRIFANVKSVRENLRNAYQSQLDQNIQLLRLSDYVKNSLNNSDADSTLISTELISEIIEVDYIEIAKVRNSIPLSIIQKIKTKNFSFIPFKELLKQDYLFRSTELNIKYFKGKRGESDIYSAMLSIKFKNTVFGYILLEKSVPFSHNEKELISLYVDYINLLNDNISFRNELKIINDSYRKEINIIRKLEVSKLPDFSLIEGYDTAFSFMPAQELSGDFFDGFFLDEDTYQIILCDISGHGISSSYVGNQVRTLFREKSAPGKKPSEIAKEVNEVLFSELSEFRFYCTAQIVQIFFDTNTILFLSAGHPKAIICRDSCRDINLTGNQSPVIGLFKDEIYREEIIKLTSGDSLLLYTDGIIEEHSTDTQEMYGVNRLIESLNGTENLSASEILHHSLGNFYEFNGYRPQDDDITLICIKKL
jgi:serine phosphatase RsbU (regulator of sigma subunit)/CheY-like chemotaxis protein